MFLTYRLAHLSVCMSVDQSVGLPVCAESVLWQNG